MPGSVLTEDDLPLEEDLAEVGGQPQSAVDVAARIDALFGALNAQAADELRARIHDSTGTQVDPAIATEYLDYQNTGYDLVGSGDLTVGPQLVKQGTAVVIAATSTDNNPFSVSVQWEDSSGAVFQSESAADIGLANVTEDYARLVRKAPRAEITVTDESGATQNNINIHADTER
jgi:hypothetical protein